MSRNPVSEVFYLPGSLERESPLGAKDLRLQDILYSGQL